MTSDSIIYHGDSGGFADLSIVELPESSEFIDVDQGLKSITTYINVGLFVFFLYQIRVSAKRLGTDVG